MERANTVLALTDRPFAAFKTVLLFNVCKKKVYPAFKKSKFIYKMKIVIERDGFFALLFISF